MLCEVLKEKKKINTVFMLQFEKEELLTLTKVARER